MLILTRFIVVFGLALVLAPHGVAGDKLPSNRCQDALVVFEKTVQIAEHRFFEKALVSELAARGYSGKKSIGKFFASERYLDFGDQFYEDVAVRYYLLLAREKAADVEASDDPGVDEVETAARWFFAGSELAQKKRSQFVNGLSSFRLFIQEVPHPHHTDLDYLRKYFTDLFIYKIKRVHTRWSHDETKRAEEEYALWKISDGEILKVLHQRMDLMARAAHLKGEISDLENARKGVAQNEAHRRADYQHAQAMEEFIVLNGWVDDPAGMAVWTHDLVSKTQVDNLADLVGLVNAYTQWFQVVYESSHYVEIEEVTGNKIRTAFAQGLNVLTQHYNEMLRRSRYLELVLEEAEMKASTRSGRNLDIVTELSNYRPVVRWNMFHPVEYQADFEERDDVLHMVQRVLIHATEELKKFSTDGFRDRNIARVEASKELGRTEQLKKTWERQKKELEVVDSQGAEKLKSLKATLESVENLLKTVVIQ